MRNRLYNLDDALLLQRSRTLRQHFIDNLAAFTNMDADLNNTFADNWLLKIKECEDCPTDETMDDDLRDHTATMQKARKACLKAANGLKYYVEKAFPDTDAEPHLTEEMLREFGFTERKKIRDRTRDVILWILIMGTMAETEYLAELTAANMPVAVLDTLHESVEDLLEAEMKQELFKRTILRTTRARVVQFNALYKIFSTVHLAAQSTFEDDKERRELFNMT
ncbi:MAG: hypothetical protein V4615_12610 [Bacteroidota bacterium]